MLNEQGAQQFKEKSNNRSRTDVKVKAKGDGDTELDRDNDSDNGGEDDEEGEGISKEEMKDVCKDDLALRIYSTIKTTILPQLHKCITKKVILGCIHEEVVMYLFFSSLGRDVAYSFFSTKEPSKLLEMHYP